MSGLAVIVGLGGALLAKVLLVLIGIITHLAYLGAWGSTLVQPDPTHRGPIAIVIPVIGGVLVGLIARFGSEKIRGHGIPEAIQSILEGDSIIQARVAFWEDIRFGEWRSDSNATSSTLVYSEDSSSWYAGEENYPSSNAALAQVDPNFIAYQSFDGVSLVPGATLSSATRSASSYTMPAPPTCTLDAYGYCVATNVATSSSIPGSACGGPTYPLVKQTITNYQILNVKKILAPYKHTVLQGGSCGTNTGSWAPSNPAISLNDPNLP